MLARVGVKVDLNAEPKSKFFASISAAGGFDSSFYLLGWTPSTLESFNVFQYIMGCRDPKTNWGGNNVGGYCNPKVDALARKALEEPDEEKRDDIFAKAWQMSLSRRRRLRSRSISRRWPGACRRRPMWSSGRTIITSSPGSRRIDRGPPRPSGAGLAATGSAARPIGDTADDRLHSAAPRGVDRRSDRSRSDRVRDVPLCRRSGEPDGRDRDFGPGTRAIAPSARPRSADDRSGRPLSRQCGAVRFRRLLPVQAAGRGSHRRAHARHPRTRARRRRSCRSRPASRWASIPLCIATARSRGCSRRFRSSAYRCRPSSSAFS